MKTEWFNKIMTSMLSICVSSSLYSCGEDNPQTEESEVTLKFFFRSTSEFDNVELFVFDRLGFFVGALHGKKSQAFSINLPRGIYTIVAWSNVYGIFIPENPIPGVTKIGDMGIMKQTSDDHSNNHMLLGMVKNLNIQGSGTEIISLSEFNGTQPLGVTVTDWDTMTSDMIIM